MYSVRYVHKIAPRDSDVGPDVDLPPGAFSSSKTLAAALRNTRILESGRAIQGFRVEGNRVVVFPRGGIWHSIILTS